MKALSPESRRLWCSGQEKMGDCGGAGEAERRPVREGYEGGRAGLAVGWDVGRRKNQR